MVVVEGAGGRRPEQASRPLSCGARQRQVLLDGQAEICAREVTVGEIHIHQRASGECGAPEAAAREIRTSEIDPGEVEPIQVKVVQCGAAFRVESEHLCGRRLFFRMCDRVIASRARLPAVPLSCLCFCSYSELDSPSRLAAAVIAPGCFIAFAIHFAITYSPEL